MHVSLLWLRAAGLDQEAIAREFALDVWSVSRWLKSPAIARIAHVIDHELRMQLCREQQKV
jgi:hypothetical protein